MTDRIDKSTEDGQAITAELERAEEALHTSEQQYGALAANAGRIDIG
jgi:hypothetical protein